MLMNLSLASLSISNILGINVATVIFPILNINFTKIHTDSEVIISKTLLFGRMLSFVKKVLLSVMNRVILPPYRWEIDALVVTANELLLPVYESFCILKTNI